MTAPKGAGATIVYSVAAPKTQRGHVDGQEDVYGIDASRDKFLVALAGIGAKRLRQQTETANKYGAARPATGDLAQAGHGDKKEQR
jgi:hypothetical protein